MVRSIIAFTLLMVTGLLLILIGMQNQLILKKPVVVADTVFEIKRGDSLEAICKRLRKRSVGIHPFWFKLFALRKNLDHVMKPGEYVLVKDSTAADILELFSLGKTRQYSITFPEGWSFKQVFQEIKNNPNIVHTVAEDQLQILMTYIGSDKQYPEGLFFPDTYFFEKNSSDVELLKRAHEKMLNVLNEEWKNRDSELPLENSYQALILASIIEKETAAADERKRISGVFTRRLKKGMLLQTDPTVIYGMGDHFHGDIHYKDLREPTPYNTYVNAGLPPTPISMPGKEAIVAALHPDDGNSLYFVSRGDGHHAFSSTFAEHEKYVDRYQR